MARSDWGIGIVGLGGVSPHHFEGYRRQGLRVIGGADIDPDRVRAAQERYGPLFFTGDFRALIDHPEVRIVDVTVQPDRLERRLAIVQYAAERGKAILIQKPLMRYLDLARKLIEPALSRGVPVMVNQNSVFAPGMLVAEKLLRDPDKVGRLYYCQIENRAWVSPGPENQAGKDQRWVQADMAVHHFALVRHWFGDVLSLYAVHARDATQEHALGDTLGVTSIRFKSGMQAVIINDWCYRGSATRAHDTEEIVVQGEKACLTLDSEHVRVTYADGTTAEPPVVGTWFPDAFGGLMAHYVDALDAGAPFSCEGRDNLKTIAMIEAAYRSAAENRVVFPDELM